MEAIGKDWTGKGASGFEPGQELSSQGLQPRSWDAVLESIRSKLSPEDGKTFLRLHKNFVGYSSETTLCRFYDFVFSRGLQLDVNGFRFRRLEKILAGLARRTPLRGGRLLEVGAGAGLVATAAARLLSPSEITVQDLCSGARAYLAGRGMRVLPHPPPPLPDSGAFHLILCADSLGEINSDEDGFLKNPDNGILPEAPDMMEERYGFAQKAAAWKPYLAPAGKLLIWEPFTHRAAWNTLARSMQSAGWSADLDESVQGGEYLELSLP